MTKLDVKDWIKASQEFGITICTPYLCYSRDREDCSAL